MQAYFIMENINPQTAQKIFLELVEDIDIKHKKLLLDNPGIEIFLKSLLKESYKDDEKICYVALSPSKICTPKENELIEVNNWYGAIKRYDIGMAIASIYIRDFPQYQAMLQAPMYITRLRFTQSRMRKTYSKPVNCGLKKLMRSIFSLTKLTRLSP